MTRAGTGKTYAFAFAMREEDQKRVLFLVHREQIAKQAMESYRRVFGGTRTFGLLSGNSKNYNADYLFATMQMMSKGETLAHFKPDTFQTIIVDETHRIGSASYQKILNYFHPDFLLGMSATPERSDGYDVYALFDYNIAYEIRLQQAMEEDLLCPFHYFGITDLTIDGETADDFHDDKDAARHFRQFSFLTCDARVDYIMEKAAYYGYSGGRVKGLMFVSRRDVGEKLSEKFNKKGLKTVFLSGEASQENREEYIEKLTTDDPEAEHLDYILTVDIFNEIGTPKRIQCKTRIQVQKVA